MCKTSLYLNAWSLQDQVWECLFVWLHSALCLSLGFLQDAIALQCIEGPLCSTTLRYLTRYHSISEPALFVYVNCQNQ